jgi:hypothetical protein
MTTAQSTEMDKRGPGRPRKPGTLAADLLAAVRRKRLAIEAASRVDPRERYLAHPELFPSEVLGVYLAPWQLEMFRLIVSHKRVAISSGHKTGKSRTLVIAALWFYYCFDEARVVFSSATAKQVDGVLWRELRMVLAQSKTRIDGDLHELARSGFRDGRTFREIVGFTAREAEAIAGISGRNVMFIIDEASGVTDIIFEALEGNRASGARIVLTSNPTRTSGEFYEAFHGKKQFYAQMQVSSEIAAAHVPPIPGLADASYIEEKKQEWGVDSPLYLVRIKGEFALGLDGKIISLDAISQAEVRWWDAKEDGDLVLGVDVAGQSERADESAIAMRRGNKILSVHGWHGLPIDGIAAQIMGLLRQHARRRERPAVIVDAQGTFGAQLLGRLRVLQEDAKSEPFEVHGVISTARGRQPQFYANVRAELWANLEQWLREGGSIPTDTKLARQLHVQEWDGDRTDGKLRVRRKDVAKKELGGSPDRADAVALACWTPVAMRPGGDGAEANPEGRDYLERSSEGALDPYAALDAWQRG